MQNLTDNFVHNPAYLIGLLVAIVALVIGLVIFIKDWRLYGTAMFIRKIGPILAVVGAGVATAILVVASQPYTPPAADTLAIVVGNTQNTPQAKLSDSVADLLTDTMAQHSGDDKETLASSIVLVEASGNPTVIDVDSEKLKVIGQNSANAKTQLNDNAQAINDQIAAIRPDNNGANYLEAIITASNNLQQGANIVVIGSGLSDRGDLNFAGTNILTNETTRQEAINNIVSKYGGQMLMGYNVTFYGLGDTVEPQAPLSNYQRKIVQDIYAQIISGLGGRPTIGRGTMSGDAVNTDYVVNTTDTGCGNVEMTFSEDQVKFNPDQTTFVNEAEARKALQGAVDFYNQSGDLVQTIQIDGYTAHYTSRVDNLSQARADAVRQLLIDMGIPQDKLVTTGRGYGPFEYNDQESNDDVDSKNRMIKLTIQRDAEECQV